MVGNGAAAVLSSYLTAKLLPGLSVGLIAIQQEAVYTVVVAAEAQRGGPCVVATDSRWLVGWLVLVLRYQTCKQRRWGYVKAPLEYRWSTVGVPLNGCLFVLLAVQAT